MPYDLIVLAKQVPDTSQVTTNAMKPDGTLNRAALPAIFNPDDLAALELALRVRDQHGGRVTVLSMGPPQAADILREALYRGADQAILMTDRKAAGSDTLATSYLLACAVRKVGAFDLVFCGRQAIDGDTAQVGPQVAEKLGLPQITYAEAIEKLDSRTIIVRRALPLGTETVECQLPCLITVSGAGVTVRPPSARRLIRYKLAATPLEYETLRHRWPEFSSDAELDSFLVERGLRIPVWSAADVGADESRIGLAGSPTKVARVDYVVLQGRGCCELAPSPADIQRLIGELIDEYII